MLLHFPAPDRLERSDADVQRHTPHENPRLLDAGQELFREVQARRRRRDGSVARGIDRLVPLQILRTGFAPDVRRKGSLPQTLQFGPDVRFELQHPPAVGFLSDDLPPQLRVELQRLADLQLSRGVQQRMPAVASVSTHEERVHPSPRPATADNACRHDASVVQNEEVSRPQVPGEVSEPPVFPPPPPSGEHQQARIVPWCCRLDGDELPRENVVEFFKLHPVRLPC